MELSQRKAGGEDRERPEDENIQCTKDGAEVGGGTDSISATPVGREWHRGLSKREIWRTGHEHTVKAEAAERDDMARQDCEREERGGV